MGASGGASRGSSSAQSGPWAGVQPFLSSLYRRAQDVSNVPLQAFPGEQVAARDPITNAALQNTGSLGIQGTPLLSAGLNNATQTLRGDFLDPSSNPFLQNTFNAAAGDVSRAFNTAVLPGLEARFAGAGRSGSPLHLRSLNEASRNLAGQLGNLANDIYGGNYQAERGRQLQAQQLAPQLSSARFGELNQATQAGLERENYAQRIIDDLVGRFEFLRDEEQARLERFANLLSTQPATGSTSSSSQRSFNLGFSLI